MRLMLTGQTPEHLFIGYADASCGNLFGATAASDGLWLEKSKHIYR